MAITFYGSSIYVDGVEPSQGALYGFSNSTYYPYNSSNINTTGYMVLSNVKYYVAGYSVKYYITRLKYYTDKPLSSLTFSVRCATDNTNGTYQRGLVVSTDSTIATNYSSYKSRTDHVNIRFTSTTVSVTWNGNIPAGYFYVYLGPGANDTNGKYSTMYAAQQSLSDGTAGFRITSSTVGKYTISYNANGGKGTTASQSVTAGESINLQNNGFTPPTAAVHTLTLDGNGGKNGTPSFQRNYFSSWRTGKTSGTTYAEGASFEPTGNTTLYARWGTYYIWGSTTRDSVKTDGYTITYDANGGTCSTGSTTVEDITKYDFQGWGTSASATSATYNSTTAYGQTDNYTAYAVWKSSTTKGSTTLPTPTNKTTSTLKITFNYQGGSGSPTSANSTKTIAKAFKGWATSSTATSGSTGSYTPDKSRTLYAIWGTSTTKYSAINLPTPTKTGYKFMGWATSASATEGSFGSYTPTSGSITTLYAIWKANGNIRIYVNSTDKYKMAMVYVYAPTSTSDTKPWKLVIPYLYTSGTQPWKIIAG